MSWLNTEIARVVTRSSSPKRNIGFSSDGALFFAIGSLAGATKAYRVPEDTEIAMVGVQQRGSFYRFAFDKLVLTEMASLLSADSGLRAHFKNPRLPERTTTSGNLANVGINPLPVVGASLSAKHTIPYQLRYIAILEPAIANNIFVQEAKNLLSDVWTKLHFEAGEPIRRLQLEQVAQEELFPPTISYEGQSFEPSHVIMDLINAGIRAHVSHLPEQKQQFVTHSYLEEDSSTDAKARFLETLEELVSMVAFRQIDGIYKKEPLTTNKTFTLMFQHAFLDLFPIIPVDLQKFQSRLRGELMEFLRKKGRFGGRWGSLAILDGEIEFELSNSLARGVEVASEWEFATEED